MVFGIIEHVCEAENAESDVESDASTDLGGATGDTYGCRGNDSLRIMKPGQSTQREDGIAVTSPLLRDLVEETRLKMNLRGRSSVPSQTAPTHLGMNNTVVVSTGASSQAQESQEFDDPGVD